MLISYNWLQTYFKEKLPDPEKLGEILTFAAFELEGIEKKGEDSVLDIKVLPDRAHYALCHRGIARDISAILNLELFLPKLENVPVEKMAELNIKIENKDDCPRYEGRRVGNLKVGASPKWLVEKLEAIGQRSINNIVDIANYVMFDVGQPLHAFDADKVKGEISIRRAILGEKIVTLDNRDLSLDDSVLLVTDDSGPLGVAGIKGGNKAGVTSETTNLILEAAHFNPSLLRRTSNKIGIRTDALKRFENEPSSEITSIAMDEFSSLILKVCPVATFGEIVDEYPLKQPSKVISTSVSAVLKSLGISVAESEIVDKLGKLGIGIQKKGDMLNLAIPPERIDLNISEDIAEEVGRLIGYDKVPATLPPKWQGEVEIPKSFYFEWKIRSILVEAGFSEVMTSSFGEKGEIAIEKPLADDKSFVRVNLRSNFTKVLNSNSLNAPLLGTDEVKIFEIGKVFGKEGERSSLILGVSGPKKKIAGQLEHAIKLLTEKLGTQITGESKDGIFEGDLGKIFESAPEISNWDLSVPTISESKFKPFSVYPFIVRDIALFVSSGTSTTEVENVISKSAGEFLVNIKLFDQFEKGGKISYAFRLVFQSFEKTLTDDEANAFMAKVNSVVTENGWEVR